MNFCKKLNFLCRYDARNEALNASIWSEDAPRGFGSRAQFDPKDISLRIDNVQEHEGGLYRCRLDFKRSQTRNVLVNLTVIGKATHSRIPNSNSSNCERPFKISSGLLPVHYAIS